MGSKDCGIPTPIKVLGWGLVGLIGLYFYKEFLEYPDAKIFLEKQGSLIAGIIAFLAAVIALYSQRESVQRQLDFQRKMESDRVFSEKLEEMYAVVQQLKTKVALIRVHLITDHVLDIDVLNKDIDRIVLLQRLYKIADETLFQEYRAISYGYLEVWSDITRDYIEEPKDGKRECTDAEELISRFMDLRHKADIFFRNTDKFLVHLSSQANRK